MTEIEPPERWDGFEALVALGVFLFVMTAFVAMRYWR